MRVSKCSVFGGLYTVFPANVGLAYDNQSTEALKDDAASAKIDSLKC